MIIDLLRKIQRKRKIRKLFQAYGRAVYHARINYVERFLPEPANGIGQVSYKPRLRKIVVAILILAMLMALAIVGAKTLDIPLPTISFVERDNHSEVTVNLEENDLKHKRFLEITYVPEGYTHVETEQFANASCRAVYVNAMDEYLYINQYQSKETTMNIDNENCERYAKSIAGTDVEVFSYEDGGKIYLLVKKQIYIVIQGNLRDTEMQQIVENLI